jgi:hypothetical protein
MFDFGDAFGFLGRRRIGYQPLQTRLVQADGCMERSTRLGSEHYDQVDEMRIWTLDRNISAMFRGSGLGPVCKRAWVGWSFDVHAKHHRT